MLIEYSNNFEIEILIKALNAVAVSYTKFEYGRVVNKIQRPERVFTAELYHQLRKLQENNFFSDGVLVHQEPNKQGDFSINNFSFNVETNKKATLANPRQIPCLSNVNYKRLSPDIVLHKNQNNSNPSNQRLVCEIKMEGSSWYSLEKDFNKLLFYKLSRLQFQNAVFIYSGSIEIIKAFLFTLPLSFLECLQNNKIIIALPFDKNKQNYEWKAYQINLDNHR